VFDIVAVDHCPNPDIRDCPLYVASHGADVPGCCTGDWALGCAVTRGEMNYAEAVANIRWGHREWWDEFVRRVTERMAREQRERNRAVSS
jgi:hypothetical protein